MSNANFPQQLLRQGAETLGLTLSDAQIAQLLGYHALIQKWNKVYNLTAIRDPAEMLTHHLLEVWLWWRHCEFVWLAWLTGKTVLAIITMTMTLLRTNTCTNCWMLALAQACLAWC